MKKTIAISLVIFTIAILVAVGVVVVAQNQEPQTERDGVAGGGGERAGDSYALTDVIGLPAVGYTHDGNVDLYAGMVWLGGAQPFVTTDPATGLTPRSGTLNGTLHSMGTAKTVDVCFEWDHSPGAPYAYHTGTITLSGTGSFSVGIGGLIDNQDYYFRAYAVGDGYDYGNMLSFRTPNEPGIIYVNCVSPGSGNGTSWGSAYSDLNEGLSRAGTGDEVWVASGTYQPKLPGYASTRIDSFQLKSQVGIYGGFDGSEETRIQRDWYSNRTVLSGDIGIAGDNTDNCYQVVTVRSVGGPSTVLDGFTILGGNANSSSGNYDSGGGMYISNGSPVVRNCVFKENSAYYGGALFNYDSSPCLTNCTWWNNVASISGGEASGGQQAAAQILIGSLTTEQVRAGGWSAGGAVYNEDSHPVITNCTFSDNSAEIGGAILNDTLSYPVITNSILWNDSAMAGPELTGSPLVTYSDVKGGSGDPWFGTGCIDEDPIWSDPSNGDFHLQTNSPCVDGGTISAIPVGVSQDFEGQGRVIGSTVDMGVDEFQAIFVNDDAPGPIHDGSSWVEAFTNLQDAFTVASNGAEIWVAGGTYTPGNNRTDYFQLKDGVQLYGGFDGISGTKCGRNWWVNRTVLSGDIGVQGDASDNCYHVFYHTGSMNLDSSAVLDGFIITGGNADSSSSEPDKRGGGMYNSDASPTITNCTFTGNLASYYGGGIYNESNSVPVIANTIFSDNQSVFRDGAGMYNKDSSPVVTNCTFYGNTADDIGGGIYNLDSSPTVTNCVLWGDTGGEIYDDGSAPTVTYSNIQNGYPGKGNVEGTPMFVNSLDSDFHLQPHSPCVNAGTNSATNLPGIDFEKGSRIVQGRVDIGVDETCRYTLNASSGIGGIVSLPGEGDFSYYCMAVAPILAEADACYEFAGWTGTGTPALTNPGSPDTTITMNADYSLTAEFVLHKSNLTLTDSGSRAIVIPYEGTQEQDCGDTVDIDVTEIDPCYLFDRWTGDTAYLTGTVTQASNSVNILQEDITLTANYTVNQFELTIASGTGGSVVDPGEGVFPYNCGQVVPIVAQASPGYAFSGWTGPGTPAITNPASPNTTITVDDDRDVSASFEQIAVIVDIYLNLEGGSRPYPLGWEVPVEIGFFPANSGTLVMSGEPEAAYWFEGISTGTATVSGTRAFFRCPIPVAVGTYDITADSETTLMNVRRAVGIW